MTVCGHGGLCFDGRQVEGQEQVAVEKVVVEGFTHARATINPSLN